MLQDHKKLLLAVSSLVLLGAAFYFLTPSQPRYEGKRLDEWLRDLDSASSDQQKAEAKKAIHQMGLLAVPYLLREIRCRDSEVKAFLRTLANRQRVIRVTFTPAVQRRMRANRAFPEVASVATPAVPELADALTDADSDVRMRAANCLVWVAWEANADKAVSALIRALRDPDMGVRYNAAAALKNMRTPAASQAVPLLLERLSSDERFEVRGSAAEALGAIRPASRGTIQALIEALRDDTEGVRSCAARALGNLGADAKDAVPELLRLAKEDNDYIRWRAREELKKIAPDAPAPNGVK